MIRSKNVTVFTVLGKCGQTGSPFLPSLKPRGARGTNCGLREMCPGCSCGSSPTSREGQDRAGRVVGPVGNEAIWHFLLQQLPTGGNHTLAKGGRAE